MLNGTNSWYSLNNQMVETRKKKTNWETNLKKKKIIDKIRSQRTENEWKTGGKENICIFTVISTEIQV